jgi:hypothetical protein
MFENVYPREKYLVKLRPFYNSDIIKVITGACVKIGLNQEKPYK